MLQYPDGTLQTAAATTATATNGSAALGTYVNLTGGNAAYQDIGLTITLPSAGTYALRANVRGIISYNGSVGSGQNYITAKLYNVTDSADVANTEVMVVLTEYTPYVNAQSTGSIDTVVTVNGAKVIHLYAFRYCTATCTGATIASDTNGRTRLSYVKLSN